MGMNMGLDFGLEKESNAFKRQFRWLFKIPGISASGVNSLPPEKSARPSISFKEIQVEHLSETISYPGKPQWKPVTLTLFDLKRNKHPIFEWIKSLYNPCGDGSYQPPGANEFKKTATLEMYDGCGEVCETWVYENAWPQSVEFGTLDMSESGYLSCEITLIYDRAYIPDEC